MTATPDVAPQAPAHPTGAASPGVKITTLAFLLAPPAALLAAAVFALPPTWPALALAAVLYVVSMGGVTIGFHRLLTHRGFKASPWLRTALTIAGSTSLQGSPVGWVATHRKHHQLSDKPGDPHTPHGFGGGPRGVAKGFWHAHAGWLFDGENADVERYAPDMLKDPAVMRVERWWWAWAVAAMIVIPAAIGFALDGWIGAITFVLWAGVVRVGFAHHIAWSVNSIGHLWGKQPFISHDESRNVAWLAPLCLGESFHNAHHAYPASPRHGLLPHQWDASARLIRWFELAGWATDVKWFSAEQIAKKRRSDR